jgi:prevent-host-death family protein
VFEAKNRLSELLDLVSMGEVVAISRRGRVCAQLTSATSLNSDPNLEVSSALATLFSVREKVDFDVDYQSTDAIKAIAREGLD